MQGIYNDDLVDEDVITEWYNTTEDLSKEQQAQRQKVHTSLRASFCPYIRLVLSMNQNHLAATTS